MDQQRVDKIVLEFLQTTVLKLGTISIQNLTGRFSQLPVDVRKKFNCTKAEVKKFLLAYPDVFIVNDDEIVSISQKENPLKLLATSDQCETPKMINNGNDDSNDDEEGTEKKQRLILNCKGKVIRIFDVYGFIEYSSPDISTTSIYFDVVCFEDGQNENLYKLKVGEEVNFCAKLSIGHKAEYRATKVWRSGYSMSLQGSERCYSSSTSLASQDSYQSEVLNGFGKLVKITTNYGFIKPATNAQGNVFFFRTKVQIPNTEEITNLEDVLKVGDTLYFSAIQSRKKNADAPWEAVKVSIIPLENLLNGISKRFNKSSIIHTGSTSSTDGSYQSIGLDNDINDEKHIYNEIGTIHQLSGSEPIIHFGKNDETVMVPNNVVYKNNKLIEDFGWEIDEGAKVTFNAEYDDSHWKAVLVWIGDKPQLSNKKSHKKKQMQVKESVVSDLSPISLYDDDQSDDGIWHTSSPHIDTGTWDDENSENWPALKPPVSTKSSQAEKINLPKSLNIPEAFRDGGINTVPNQYNEKFNSAANISSYATALGNSQEVVEVSNSKKNRKKKNISDINASYATVVTALSKECKQNKHDYFSDGERIQRYKMNNGWEEESFNTNGENWPSLNEPSGLSRLTPSISKISFHRSKEKLNENQTAIQQQMPNMFNYTDFVSHKNDMQESYYSDSDEFHDQDVASDNAHNENLCLNDSKPFTKVNKVLKEISYTKFSDIMGTVVNVQAYCGFIKSEKLDQKLFFCWEQAFCDGRLVSKHYTSLGEVFNELDSVNFTYCQMIDEKGKEWISLLQVCKGKKPMETTDVVWTSKNSPEIILATTNNAAINKNSSEDSGVCIEELEICKYEDSKITNGLSSCISSSALNKTAVCHKEKEVETTVKYSDLSSYAPVNQLKASDNSSHIEKNMKCSAVGFLNHLQGLSHPSRTESINFKESLPSTLSNSTRTSVKSQETQTEVVTSDEGIQTFITGTVLSIEVFPH